MNKFAGLAAIAALLILSSSFANAQSAPNICTKDLTIEQASQEKWNPGIVLNNSKASGGIAYKIKIKIRTTGYVIFNNLITENEALPVEILKDGTRSAGGSFKKGDVVTLIARSDKNMTQSPPDSLISSKLKNKNLEAAILYTTREKQYLHPVDHFTVTESHKLSQ
jgi:hypothetical protein